MIKNEIKNIIKETLREEWGDLAANTAKIEIEIPENKTFGDYSSNIAMKMAKSAIFKNSQNPLSVAQKIKDSILINLKSPLFSKIETAKPGFINFYLSPRCLQEKLHQIISENQSFGKINVGDNKFINIEFISANPTGPLTLGNARGGFLGDILANILELAGFNIEKEYFINNAKSSRQIEELGKTFLGKSENYLTPKLKLLIKALRKNPQIEISSDAGEMGHLLSSKIQEENQKFIEKKLKIKIHNWFPEELLFENKIIKKALSFLEYNNFVYEKDGALWLKTSILGDDEDRVIIRTDGKSTYFLSDIAYHFDKFRRGYDTIIDIWGADHHGHIKRLKSGLQMLGINPSRTNIIITQMVRITSKGEKQKMSKRAGIYITLEELIREVGLDAARFFFAMRSADTHLNFDLALAKEKSEKNPLYYIQYAGARICAISRKCVKSQIPNPKSQTNSKFQILNSKLNLLIHPAELDLMKQLIRFPEIIEDIAKDYQIHRLPNYLLEMATSFHKFYENCKVICDDKFLADARLSLIKATHIVLKNGLKLMGISIPKKM